MQTIRRRKKENELRPAFRIATIIMRTLEPTVAPWLFVKSVIFVTQLCRGRYEQMSLYHKRPKLSVSQ